MIYFASDWHVSHTNILKYDDRPFATIKEHDKALLSNHNEVVKENDDFYFLGDFGFKGSTKYYESIMSKMNGRKFFIKGNHDKKDTIELYKKYGTFLGDMTELVYGKHTFVLCHYPILSWHSKNRGFIHLHGHTHMNMTKDPNYDWYYKQKVKDVSINGSNYYPLSIEQILDEMSSKVSTL
jgi:calcineurin-like phosphoesterase family protein